MGRINNEELYPKDPLITDQDIVIGSDKDSFGKTKNYAMSDIRDYLLEGLAPEAGGTLKITEVDYTGMLTSPADVLNSQNPVINVLQYNILIVSVNGDKYLFELQDVTVGLLQPEVVDSDFITLGAYVSLGTGQGRFYKGFNPTTGKQEFRTAKSVGLNVTEDSEYVIIERKESTKLGSGVNVYKGLNATTKLDEFFGLVSTGFTIVQTGNDVILERKQSLNLGDGVGVYKELNATTKVDNYYSLKSDSLAIRKETVLGVETGNITIEVPTSATIPLIAINNSYIPTYDEWLIYKDGADEFKGLGTSGKPYTDTIEYTSPTTYSITPNTAIQNGIDGYIGTGGAGTISDPTPPQMLGQAINIQNNANVGYVFTGDWNLLNGNFVLDNGTIITHVPSSSMYLVDLETFSPTTVLGMNITMIGNSEIRLQKSGFKNKGTTVIGGTFVNSKIINIFGDGRGVITQVNTLDYATPDLYSVIESNWENTAGYANDSNATFNVSGVKVRAFSQNVYKIGGDRIVDFTNVDFTFGLIGSDISTSAKPFRHKGNHYSRSQKCSYQVFGNQKVDMVFEFDETPSVLLSDPLFNGSVKTLFYNVSTTDKANLRITDSTTNDGIFMDVAPNYRIFDSNLLSGTWDTIYFNNCFISRGYIDRAKVDLTRGNGQSCLNFIGRVSDSFPQISEDLIIRTGRTTGSFPATDVPSGTRFINTNGDDVTDPPTDSWYLDITI